MSTVERPDTAALEQLGQTETAATAWAGAPDAVSRGLKAWTRQAIGDDHRAAVRAALAASELAIASYPAEGPDLRAPRRYVDDMVAAIRAWVADPSRENQDKVRSQLDVTRDRHAWQDEHDLDHLWALEALDHASLAVWSGERSSYIVPLDFATSAARSVACAYHALATRGPSRDAAATAVVDAVRTAVDAG